MKFVLLLSLALYFHGGRAFYGPRPQGDDDDIVTVDYSAERGTNEHSSEEMGPLQHHLDFDELFPGQDQEAADDYISLEEEDRKKLIIPDWEPFLRRVDGNWDPDPSLDTKTTIILDENWGPGQDSFPKAWWEGSNVCIKREESPNNETTDFLVGVHFSACEELDTRYDCYERNTGITIKSHSECCTGYELNPERKACVRIVLKDVIGKAREVGGKEFSELAGPLMGKDIRGNVTLFVPTDAAMAASMSADDEDETRERRSIGLFPGNRHPEIRRHSKRRQEQSSEWIPTVVDYVQKERSVTMDVPKVLNHVAAGRWVTDDFRDEMILYPKSSGAGKKNMLRINVWRNGVEKLHTVNCVRMTSSNHKCSDGIVHVMDEILEPVDQNAWQFISSRPELSMFKSLLISSGLDLLVKDKRQHLTILAPTNDAFTFMDPWTLQKLNMGNACQNRILSHHILNFTFCSSGLLTRKGTINTINQDVLQAELNSNNDMFVNGSEVLIKDVVTTNAVIHVVGKVIISPNDQHLNEILERKEFSQEFVSLIYKFNLIVRLKNVYNVTLFVPNNKALEKLPPSTLDDKEEFEKIFNNHIVKPEIRTFSLSNQQQLATAAKDGSKIRINTYSIFWKFGSRTTTANCGKILSSDVGCNGVVHQVDRVLIPPSMEILEIIRSRTELKTFTKILEANKEVLKELKNKEGFFTVFAPNDYALNALSEWEIRILMMSPDAGAEFLRQHIIPEAVCCAAADPKTEFFNKRWNTLAEDVDVPFFQGEGGRKIYGGAVVMTCDLLATNGILHVINKAMEENYF